MAQRINFYEETGTFGAFSNFYRAPVIIDGVSYPTVEHYFQAQKFLGPSSTPRSRVYALIISRQSTPNKAKILANQQIKGGYNWVQELNEIIREYPDVTIRPDWEDVKDNVMRRGVYQKFKQHPELKTLLLSTGETLLVEHTNRDSYWGDGGNDQGRNQLGKTLMEVRSLFRGQPETFDSYTWLIRGVVLSGPADREALTRLGVNFLVDLSPDHSLLGEPMKEKVVVYPGPYIFVDGPDVDLTVEAIGKKYTVFLYSPSEDFIREVIHRLYD